jgi:hypothetical protein
VSFVRFRAPAGKYIDDFYFVGKYKSGGMVLAVKLCEEVDDQTALRLAYHGLASNYLGLKVR